jgi:hypothetical protein
MPPACHGLVVVTTLGFITKRRQATRSTNQHSMDAYGGTQK